MATFVKRALLLSTGVAAGVGSAPYLCASAPPSRSGPLPRSPTDSPARAPPTIHAAFTVCHPRPRDAKNAAAPLEDTCTGGRGVAAQVVGAARTLGGAVARAVAVGAASAAAGAHAVAAASSAAEAEPSASPAAEFHSEAGGDAPGSSTSERSDALTANEGDSASSASTQAALVDKAAAFRAAPHKLKDRFLHYAERDHESGEYVLTLEGFVRCMLLLPEERTHRDEGWRKPAGGGGAPPPSSPQAQPPPPPPQTSAQASDTGAAPSFFARALGERRWGSRPARDRRGGSASASTTTGPTSWLAQLPASVQQRFLHFFRWVDLDGTDAINYAEFVVLFTFLSTPQRTLQRAFRVFDLDDNGRLSEWEFCKLLNTIMIDPAVQVHCSGPAVQSDSDAAGPPTASSTAASATDSPANAPASASAAPPLTPAASALSSAASLAGASRRSTRARQRDRAALTFELDSALLRPLLFGPLPRHVGAPPGSTHYDPSAAQVVRGVAGAADGMSGVQEGSGGTSRWRRWAQSVWRIVWPVAEARANEACTPDPRLSSAAAAVAPSSRMARLQVMAQEDTLLQMVSYPTFLYRLDYLRWELRAIEFGLCDPTNTGAITLDDCRRLIRGESRDAVAANNGGTATTITTTTTTTSTAAAATTSSDASTRAGGAPMMLVTWQSYQKMFDVVKEADRVMAALQLTLDAMPPVPPDTLRGGAIPDSALAAATAAIPALVRQSALRHAAAQSARATSSDSRNTESSTGEQHTDASLPAATDSAPATADHDRGGDAKDGDKHVTPVSADVLAAEAAEGKSVDEQRAAARRVQTSLVRPTALTWQQFNRVLESLGAAAQLSEVEAELFRALFDDDGSDSLSPAEFARVCSLKETFFAQQLPRFDEPKRNAIQQFFYCMQQLE